MCRNVLLQGAKCDFKCKAILGNDDSDVCFYGTKINTDGRILAEEYMNIEHDVHASLGNITNFKKTVVKPYGLFYEQYDKEGWRDKEALLCNALACAYLAPTIRVAKHYIVSQSERFTSDWAFAQLEKLAVFWGAEFFSVHDEIRIHYELGGWLDIRSMGLKTSLSDAFWLADRWDVKRVSYAQKICSEFAHPPIPKHTRVEMVNNYKYLGGSCKSNPKIQMFTLGDEDLKEYYKKLTTYQRNYSKRLDGFLKRTKYISVTREMNTVIERLLGREPWYTIPRELVHSEDILFDGIETDVRYELDTGEYSDPVGHALEELANLKGDGNIEDLKWDPCIPPEAFNFVLKCGYEHILSCSQFSNSGILPILEYHKRYDSVPFCKPIGRIRWMNELDERIDFQIALSRFSFSIADRDNLVYLPNEEDEDLHGWGSSIIPEELPIEAGFVIDDTPIKEFLAHSKKPPDDEIKPPDVDPILANGERQSVYYMRRIEELGGMEAFLNTRLDHHVIFPLIYPNIKDVEEEEEGDYSSFGMFGDADED